jgi:hypothetical protein
MNVPEMVKRNPKLAFALDKTCEILHGDGYYPKAKVYETAIAILTEVISNGS